MSDFVEVELELDDELIEFIEKAAKEEGITPDEFINKALSAFMEKHDQSTGNK